MGPVGTRSDELTGEQGSPISVGQELRRAREVRHVTLAQLAAETRIALRHLEALEQDRFEDLPGQLYARNFVRQVARSLGADEQELIDYFDYQSAEAAGGGGDADEAIRAGQAGKRRFAYGALAIAVLIIAAALGFALTRSDSRGDLAGDAGTLPSGSQDPAAAMPPVETAPALEAAEPATAPGESAPEVAGRTLVKAGGASVPVRQPEPEAAKPEPVAAKPEPVVAKPEAAVAKPEPVASKPPPAVVVAPPAPETDAAVLSPRVRLVFSGPSWVEIVPDGDGQQIMGLKTKGEEVAFLLDSPVELTVMNAGNVELWLDGRPTRTLGVAGKRRTLRLDADNWQSFLR